MVKKARSRTREWFDKNQAWVWRTMLGVGVLANLWLSAHFASVQDFKAFQERYWNNRKDDVKDVIALDKRVDRLETRDDERQHHRK